MLSLSDRLTVPQIFFDDKWVGGASDLEELHESGALQGMVDSLLSSNGPLSTKLQRPDYPPKEEDSNNSTTQQEEICIGPHCLTYTGIVQDFKRNLPIQLHTHRLVQYPNCFTGVELVDYLIMKYELESRGEAVQVGESLLNSRVFDHVVHDHSFEDKPLFCK